MRKVALFIALTCLVVAGLGALELKEGRMKLVLHEATGRFSIYYLSDMQAGTYTPLLLDKDPRTTVLSILYDNKIYKMGETVGFTTKIESTVDGGVISYVAPYLTVKLSFKFLKSAEASLADSVALRIEIINTGDRDVPIGARFIFDTWLAEKSNSHFFSNGQASFETESMLTPAQNHAYIASAGNTEKTIGFQLHFAGAGVTPPDQVILANWRRLSESSWQYELNSSRNFNLLPYSINDSAIAAYYGEKSLKAGQTRTIEIIMGNISSGVFSKPSDSPMGSLLQQAAADPRADVRTQAKNDLISVQDLIDKINQLMSQDRPITNEELAVLEKVIKELEQRKAQYSRQ